VTGRKDDQGKARWDLMPWREVAWVAEVVTYGGEHYGERNWRSLEHGLPRFQAAAMRHLAAWFEGERIDPGTGLPHWAHACCSLLMAAWHERRAVAGAVRAASAQGYPVVPEELLTGPSHGQ